MKKKEPLIFITGFITNSSNNNEVLGFLDIKQRAGEGKWWLQRYFKEPCALCFVSPELFFGNL